VFYREYEGVDKTISQNVTKIVELSGNVLIERDPEVFATQIISKFEEDQRGERYLPDILDGRTFQNPDNDNPITIGRLYQLNGLTTLRPASMLTDMEAIPIVKELLLVRGDRTHIVTNQRGAPRVYFMRTGCRHLINHILDYRNKPEPNHEGNPSEKPQDKNNHDIDAMRYGLTAKPTYNPARTIGEGKVEHEKNRSSRGYWCSEDPGPRMVADRIRSRRDPYTGYVYYR
jgi:hypothetical protein